MQNCFVPADILLPGAATPLDPWACIAVDQFTSQPEYAGIESHFDIYPIPGNETKNNPNMTQNPKY